MRLEAPHAHEDASAWKKARDLRRIERARAALDAPVGFRETHPWLRFLSPLLGSTGEPKLAAIRTLAAMRRPEATAALLDVIDDHGFPQRVAAIEAIARAPEPAAMQPLVALLDDADPEVRRAAARSLGFVGRAAAKDRIPVDAAFTRLKDRLSEEPVVAVRAAVLDALVMLGTTEGLVAAYEVAIRDEAPLVRCGVLSVAVGLARHYGSRKVMAPAHRLAPADFDAAGVPRTMGDLARALRQRDFQPLVDWQSGCADPQLEALARLAEVRTPDLFATLLVARASDDAGLRAVAYAGLARYRRPEALPAVLPALDDPVQGVRRAAIDGLAEREGKEAFAALASALAQPQRAEVDRQQIAAALDGSREVEALIAVLSGGAVQTRRAAARSLENLADASAAARALPLLVEGLASHDTRFRVRAAIHLAQQADDATVDRLRTLARSTSDPRASAADLALHLRGDAMQRETIAEGAQP